MKMIAGMTGTSLLNFQSRLLSCLAFFLALSFFIPLAREALASYGRPWIGKLADGREIDQAELARILQKHELYMDEGRGGATRRPYRSQAKRG